MDRRHLTYFLAVVEAGSISAAARQLHISPPAISQSIKELERDLQVQVFQRGARLTLSPAGRTLVGPARRALRAFEAVRDAVADVDQLVSGRLDIAVVPGLAVNPVVPLVTRFQARHPGVSVGVHEAAQGVDSFDSLRRAEAELLVSNYQAPYVKHAAVPLAVEEVWAVMPPTADNVPDRPMGVADLLEFRFIQGLPRHSEARVGFVSALAAEQLSPPTIVVETAHRDTIVPFVLAGAGLALLPTSEARAAERLGAQIRPITFDLPHPCFLYHRHGPLSPAALAFVSMAADAAPPGPGVEEAS